MAYHHVDTSPGVHPDAGPAAADQRRAPGLGRQPDAAPGVGQDNSFYSPGADEIRLGRGGVDDGEDADVIIHEYGHAVQDAQNREAYRSSAPSRGRRARASATISPRPTQSEFAALDDEWTPCIMEWDATAYDDNLEPGICLRRADDGRTRSRQKNFCGSFTVPNEIHCIGQVWASALLDLRDTLGDDALDDSVVDTIVLASHELVPPDPSFEQASEALIAADQSAVRGHPLPSDRGRAAEPGAARRRPRGVLPAVGSRRRPGAGKTRARRIKGVDPAGPVGSVASARRRPGGLRRATCLVPRER